MSQQTQQTRQAQQAQQAQKAQQAVRQAYQKAHLAAQAAHQAATQLEKVLVKQQPTPQTQRNQQTQRNLQTQRNQQTQRNRQTPRNQHAPVTQGQGKDNPNRLRRLFSKTRKTINAATAAARNSQTGKSLSNFRKSFKNNVRTAGWTGAMIANNFGNAARERAQTAGKNLSKNLQEGKRAVKQRFGTEFTGLVNKFTGGPTHSGGARKKLTGKKLADARRRAAYARSCRK